MPKDEIDPEDPLELRGVGLVTGEDTTDAMSECFIEEFLRLGHGAGQILALFRHPHYAGVHLVFRHRGEDYVQRKIVEVFGWWNHPVDFGDAPSDGARPEGARSHPPIASSDDRVPADPLGHPLSPPSLTPIRPCRSPRDPTSSCL
jgi:hypothetical protein